MVVGFTRKDFLEALFGDYFRRRGGFIMVKSLRNFDRKISFRYFPNIEVLSRQQYREDENVLIAVCPRESMKPEADSIRFATCMWAGLDIGPDGFSGRESFFQGPSQAAKAVRSFPLAPSIVIESGSGMHLYWLFKDMVEISDRAVFERQLTRVNTYFQCAGGRRIDALLRLPGTWNCKIPGRSATCKVKFVNLDFRYDVHEFVDLPLEYETSAAAPAVESGIEEVPAVGEGEHPDRRADEVEQVDAAELEAFLSREGMKVHRYDGPAVEQDSGGFRNLRQPDSSDGPSGKMFEPLAYETTGQPGGMPNKGALREGAAPSSQTDRLPPMDVMAGKIAERVLEMISDEMLDTLADKIVERLAKRFNRPSGRS